MNPLAIPITVYSAVALFALKEIVEFVRRTRADARKRAGVRLLLARECELNYWTSKTIRAICEGIKTNMEDGLPHTYRIIKSRAGIVHFQTFIDDEQQGGRALPRTYRETMAKVMLEVASLDGLLFSVLQRGYEATALLEHLHNGILDYVEPDAAEHENLLEGFVSYALDELDRIDDDLKKLYLECTGEELTHHRLF